MKSKKALVKRLLIVLGCLLAFYGLAFLIIYKTGLLSGITSFEEFGKSIGGAISYVVAYIGAMLSMIISTTPIIAGMSLVSSDLQVFLLSTLANILGAGILYVLGMFGGRKVIDYVSQDKAVADKWSEMVVKKVWWVFIAILFPMAPDNLIFVLSGTARMPMKYFLPIVIIGKASGILTTIYFVKLLSILNLTTILILLVIILVAVIGWLLYKRHKGK